MAHEFFLQFSPPEWYADHVDDVRAEIERSSAFVRKVSDREIWLKAEDSPGHWDYDLRIFLDPARVLIEVTTFGDAYFADLQDLLASLSSHVHVDLVDEDGEPVRWR